MKQNKNDLLIAVVIIAVLVGGIIWVSRPSGQPDDSTQTANLSGSGKLSADEMSFDFGSISMAKGKVSHKFKIINSGPGPSKISKIYTSCMCTSARLEIRGEKFGPFGMAGHGFIPKINQILNSGEDAVVDVVFDPAAHGPAGVGRISRVVAIETEGGGTLELDFSALVTP